MLSIHPNLIIYYFLIILKYKIILGTFSLTWLASET